MLNISDLVGLLDGNVLLASDGDVSSSPEIDPRREKLPPLPDSALVDIPGFDNKTEPSLTKVGDSAVYSEGMVVRDILSGKEGVVAKPPEGDFGDVVFVTFDGVTSAVRSDQLENVMPPTAPETSELLPPPPSPADAGMAAEAKAAVANLQAEPDPDSKPAEAKPRPYAGASKLLRREKPYVEPGRGKSGLEKKLESDEQLFGSHKDFVVTNLKDPRRITYSALKDFAAKNPSHASVAAHIGYIPRHWDDVVSRLASDGVVLKSAAKEFDVADFVAKKFTPTEIMFSLASAGVRLADVNAALTALAAKPTVEKPKDDPGAGNQWVWNAKNNAWEQWPIGASQTLDAVMKQREKNVWNLRYTEQDVDDTAEAMGVTLTPQQKERAIRSFENGMSAQWYDIMEIAINTALEEFGESIGAAKISAEPEGHSFEEHARENDAITVKLKTLMQNYDVNKAEIEQLLKRKDDLMEAMYRLKSLKPNTQAVLKNFRRLEASLITTDALVRGPAIAAADDKEKKEKDAKLVKKTSKVKFPKEKITEEEIEKRSAAEKAEPSEEDIAKEVERITWSQRNKKEREAAKAKEKGGVPAKPEFPKEKISEAEVNTRKAAEDEADAPRVAVMLKRHIKSASYVFSSNIGYTLDIADWKKAVGQMDALIKREADFYVDNDWHADSEDKAFEKETGIGFDTLKEVSGGNTYNQSYFGPDVNNRIYKAPGGEFFLELRVHLGGDVRGNYSGGYYFRGESEGDLVQTLYDIISGSIYATIKFDDGSDLRFYSNSDSDMPDYDMTGASVTGDSARGADTLAAQFLDAVKLLDSYDRDMFLDSCIDR